MTVQVIHSLPAVRLAVDDEPGAFFGASIALGKLPGFEKQSSQED